MASGLGVVYQKTTAVYHAPHHAELLAVMAAKRFGSVNFVLIDCASITCRFKGVTIWKPTCTELNVPSATR